MTRAKASHRRMRIIEPIAIILVLAGACSRNPESDHRASSGVASASPMPSPSNQSTTVASAAPGSVVSNEPSPSPSESPKRFKGGFKARKRKVLPQSTAEDDAWKRDDGAFAAGPGDLEITITGGAVTGEVRGPWGKLTVSGEVSGEEVYASLTATEDGNAKGPHGSFSGVLSGRIVDGAIDAKLRVSSGDAVIARDADSHLTIEPGP